MLRPFFSLFYRMGITTKNTKGTNIRKIRFVFFVVRIHFRSDVG